MKRTRSDTMQQSPKTQEESSNSKSQRRYRAPKLPQTAPKTEEVSTPVVAVDPPCTAEHGGIEDPLYVLWDELSGVWPWMVEQEVLAGWYPFVDGHFSEVGEEEGFDLHDLWRLNEIVEVPN